MIGWQKYFKLKGINPGKVHTPQNGIVDFSDPSLDLNLLKKLWESDFPYLQLSEAGYRVLYGMGLDISATNLAKMIRNTSDFQEAKLLANHRPDSKLVNQALNAFKN